MGKAVNSLEFRNGEGQIVFSVHLVEREINLPGGPETSLNKKQEGRRENSQGSGQGNGRANGEFMSEAQRRYLFRILADQGIEGDNAYAHLRNLFGVSNLKEVAKQDASRAIKKLLEGAPGGENYGSPF